MTANNVYRENQVTNDKMRVQKLYSRRRRRRRKEKRARTKKIKIGGTDMLLPPWPDHYTRVSAGKAKTRQPQYKNESSLVNEVSPESKGAKVQRHRGRWCKIDERKGTAPQVLLPNEALGRIPSSVQPSSTVSFSEAIGGAYAAVKIWVGCVQCYQL